MLRVETVSASYGIAVVLFDVSLHVDKGEIVTIVGPNGAGKTTLLKAIARLLPVKGGEICFNNEIISDLPPHEVVKRGICLIPEGRQIFSSLSVRENLLLGGWTIKGNQRARHLDLAYTLFPILKERQHQRAKSLSGGEQQMLVIGRGLMSEPTFLMLDEPSLGLAPLLVVEIFGVIVKLCEQGRTILLVEQRAVEALKLSKRGYIMATGKIRASGEAKEILNSQEIRTAYLGGGSDLPPQKLVQKE